LTLCQAPVSWRQEAARNAPVHYTDSAGSVVWQKEYLVENSTMLRVVESTRSDRRDVLGEEWAMICDLVASHSVSFDRRGRTGRDCSAPLQTLRITSPFSAGRTHPILGDQRPHNGVDLGAPLGTPVSSPDKGVVRFSAPLSAHGLTVIIDHGDGMVTMYAHLDSVDVVVDDFIEKGAPFAQVGTSGMSTGPHLHFTVWHDGEVLDPLRVLPLHCASIARLRRLASQTVLGMRQRFAGTGRPVDRLVRV